MMANNNDRKLARIINHHYSLLFTLIIFIKLKHKRFYTDPIAVQITKIKFNSY